MSHDFKVGDIAVVIHSEAGNTGRMVRIIEQTSDSPYHDVVARSLLDGEGLVCIAECTDENGETEETALTVLELPMKTKNLRKIAGRNLGYT